LEPSARDSAATRTLSGLVQEQATGRLQVGHPDGPVRVFLLGGDIVAAESDDDAERYARLLLRHRLATEERVAVVLEEAGDDVVFGLLFDGVPDAAAERILAERFHEGLCRFVGSKDQPDFTASRSVFADNLQLGHDPDILLETSCAMWDTASALNSRAVIVRGPMPPADPQHRMVLATLGYAALTVEELLEELPLESVAARACLLDMLQVGTVMVPPDDDDEMMVEDAATDAVPREYGGHHSLEEIPLDELQAAMDSDLDLAPGEEFDTEAPIPLDQLPALEVDEDVSDAPTEAEGEATSVRDWLDTSVEMDDLEAFDDHDYDRGGDNEGEFSTDSHNLDKVEVAALGSPTPEPSAGNEAPTSRFSGPVLSEAEAIEKVAVANDVLQQLASAFDSAEGSGRGRAMLQLLIDGSPARYAAVLMDLKVGRNGEVSDRILLANLAGRPSTEHRQLLNQTLVDLIDRALSAAADQLPEEGLDEVLESVAGYRQRLGR
jgi:hypothetical protein